MVSRVLLGEVESGRLRPSCRECNGGRPVTLHPVEIAELKQRGLLEKGWARIEEINEEITQGRSSTAP